MTDLVEVMARAGRLAHQKAMQAALQAIKEAGPDDAGEVDQSSFILGVRDHLLSLGFSASYGDAQSLVHCLRHVGYAVYDTRTHVAVPREPTEAMLRAAHAEVDAGVGPPALLPHEVKNLYRAMIQASERGDK